MSESVFLTAAIAVAKPRLRAYLRAPVSPASAWPREQWSGVTGTGFAEDELPAAVRECDRWLDGDYAFDGDYATVLRGLAEAHELTFRFDEATGSLAVDFGFVGRVDFRLPTRVWVCTVFRGMAGFLAGGEHGIVTVTAGWSEEVIALWLTPGHTAFLDRDRDASALAAARDREIDIRSAAGDADQPDTPADVIDRLVDEA